MSFFSAQVTVPKNTAQASPHTETLEIQTGIIHRVYVRIPSGHAGLSGVRLLQGLHQVSPTSGSEWWTGDDMAVDYDEHIEVGGNAPELTIEAYNLDDTYAHTFVIGVGVLPEWVLLPQTILKSALENIATLLDGLSRWMGMRA